MSLHGSIMVNGDQIGSWVARRTKPIPNPNTFMTYECEVQVNGGDPKVFEVQHLPREGAVVLAAKVLSISATMR